MPATRHYTTWTRSAGGTFLAGMARCAALEFSARNAPPTDGPRFAVPVESPTWRPPQEQCRAPRSAPTVLPIEDAEGTCGGPAERSWRFDETPLCEINTTIA